MGAPVPAARMDRTSAARNRLNATARASASTSACGAVRGAQRQQHVQFGGRAGCCRSRRRRRGTPPRPVRARRTAARRGFRARTPATAPAGGRRSGRRARTPHRARPAGGRRRPHRCGFGDQQPAAVLHQPDRGADQPGRHRVPGGGEPHAGQPVDLPGHRRRPDLQPQRRQRAQHLPLGEQPGRRGPRQISECTAAFTSAHHRAAAVFASCTLDRPAGQMPPR